MLLSSTTRASPPKPLKFGGSKPDRYLSIRHLLPSTPIPSPSLPSILPRHGKKPPKLNSRKIVRGILWLSFVIGIYYLVSFGRKAKVKPRGKLGEDSAFLSPSGKEYEIVEASELPDFPTPLAVTDSNGKPQWTISIPAGLRFPLPPTEYIDICSQSEEVARHVAGGTSQKNDNSEHQTEAYYHEDPNFIDVDEAITNHLLPPTPQPHNSNSSNPLPICTKSLTYILDAHDAGLGSALLGIWLSHSLAVRESRTFFIDDSHFPYGNYSNFLASLPPAPCRLPPPSHRLPCPRQAKHLVISSATTPWIFGEAFHAQFSQREIFDMARDGYDALFYLRPEEANYITNRVSKLRAMTSPAGQPLINQESGSLMENGLVGIHIRRGDRHPFSLAYSQNYIPPTTYMATALRLVGQATHQWRFLLASDDADLYNTNHPDLSTTIRAQERISLASKKSLERMGHSSKGALGWEGGFFKDVFWGLGLSDEEKWAEKRRLSPGSPMPMKERHRFGEKGEDGREKRVHHHDRTKSKKKVVAGGSRDGKNPHAKNANPAKEVPAVVEEERDYRTNPTTNALQLRELLGKAYLLDLAMLAQSDKIVCGVSANACRILAVMLGWERAFERGDWNNVDGGYGWRVMDY